MSKSNIFDTIERIKLKRSNFDLSHSNKFTCDMGQLIPCCVEEVMPGDKFSIDATALVKFAPLLAPQLSNCYATIHYWFVPYRIIWKDFEDFIRGGDDGTLTPVAPYMTLSGRSLEKVAEKSLLDYLGLPEDTPLAEQFSALFARAYAKIWNEYYRDEDLQDPVDISLESGEDTTTNLAILFRAWAKDYFTSARSQAQLGDGASISIGGDAPVAVYGNGKALSVTNGSINCALAGTENYGLTAYSGGVDAVVGSARSGSNKGSSAVNFGLNTNPNESGIEGTVDLSQASPISIVDLRYAFQFQKFIERSMRAGNRIKEYYLAHFGVNTSDARLQLPEYLGGVKSQISFSEIVQSSSSTDTSPQGNMAGHGMTLMGKSLHKTKYFEEFGVIIGLFSVLPVASYSQGIPKRFSRKTRFDFPLPVFQHVGEQAIKMKEIYAGAENPDETFGYAPRYAEMKYHPDEIHGDFKKSLAFWHLGRIFENAPALNSDFIQCKPSTRIYAVESMDYNHLYVNLYNSIKVKRSLDYYSSPGLVDHF